MAAGSRRDTLESQRPSEQQEEGGGGDEDSTSLLNESGIGSTSINRNSASRHPASSPRRSWNPRTWGLGINSLVILVIGLIITTIVIVTPRGPRSDPSLRAGGSGGDPPRADPSFYFNFIPQLILRGGNEDWVSFDPAMADHYFTPEEMTTLPIEGEGTQKCEVEGLPQHCCLGSFSMAGIMVWDEAACRDANYYKFQVPHKGVSLGHYRDMGDVLQVLGNRSITFIGDSVASQHAHAMECSWLRSRKSKTLNYEKVDLNRIFNANGTGFTVAGRYGTNAYYTWRTDTDGVEARMKLNLQYRPNLDMNETLAAMEESDVLVINFGLHYMLKEKNIYVDEMTHFLSTLKAFANTPGKVLIWRETSAQHHLNEGGEYPLVEEPERMGMTLKQYKDAMNVCHPIRFGSRISPQWRDRIILQIADQLGYRVEFLGSYEGLPSVNGRRRRGANSTCTHVRSNGEMVAGSTVDGLPVDKPILYWLPFFRISSERVDLHPYNKWRGKFDCTHYCFTPLLWDPLVDGLAASLEDAERREESKC